MKHNTIVFSIALNGYQWRYRQYLSSHRAYAKRFNYHYQAVTRPIFSGLGIECCWLKLTLMHTALNAGYKHVMFVDADAMIQTTCPAIESVLENDKSLYMAKGYSKRFNSGVMIVRNSLVVRQWISRVIAHRATPVAPENDVGWGENSHIIELSHQCRFIQELPQRWNNTSNPRLDDYIRHHNYGPLRTNFWDNLLHRAIFCIADRLVRLAGLPQPIKHQALNAHLLGDETNRVLTYYPSFSTPPERCV